MTYRSVTFKLLFYVLVCEEFRADTPNHCSDILVADTAHPLFGTLSIADLGYMYVFFDLYQYAIIS